MKAVVTAGGRIDGAYAAAAGTSVKALAKVRGITMLARVIEALRTAGVTRLAVVGGAEVRRACAADVDRFVEETSSGSANALLALHAWPEDGGALLYATSDLPYVTADAVCRFIERVPPAVLAVALVESASFARRFPDAPPFGLTLAGERVVNGGIFSVPDESRARLAAVLPPFFEARKRPWRMARLVSPFDLCCFALGRLSIERLETVAGTIVGVRTLGVRGCAPELGFDADTLADYRYACTHP